MTQISKVITISQTHTFSVFYKNILTSFLFFHWFFIMFSKTAWINGLGDGRKTLVLAKRRWDLSKSWSRKEFPHVLTFCNFRSRSCHGHKLETYLCLSLGNRGRFHPQPQVWEYNDHYKNPSFIIAHVLKFLAELCRSRNQPAMALLQHVLTEASSPLPWLWLAKTAQNFPMSIT